MTDEPTRQQRLGQALRNLREPLGLTIYDVARRMGRKRSYGSHVGRWERAAVMPRADQLWAYLRAVGATFADLGRELDPEPETNPRLEAIKRRLQELP